MLEAKCAKEKEENRNTRTEDIIVYTLVGTYFFII